MYKLSLQENVAEVAQIITQFLQEKSHPLNDTHGSIN